MNIRIYTTTNQNVITVSTTAGFVTSPIVASVKNNGEDILILGIQIIRGVRILMNHIGYIGLQVMAQQPVFAQKDIHTHRG